MSADLFVQAITLLEQGGNPLPATLKKQARAMVHAERARLEQDIYDWEKARKAIKATPFENEVPIADAWEGAQLANQRIARGERALKELNRLERYVEGYYTGG